MDDGSRDSFEPLELKSGQEILHDLRLPFGAIPLRRVCKLLEGRGIEIDESVATTLDIHDQVQPAFAILCGVAACELNLEAFTAAHALLIQPSKHPLSSLHAQRCRCAASNGASPLPVGTSGLLGACDAPRKNVPNTSHPSELMRASRYLDL